MWFFKNKKKEEEKKTEVEKKEKKYEDIEPIIEEFYVELIPLVKETAKKGVISVPQDSNHNTYGERLDILNKDGEIPQGWYLNNKEYLDSFERKMTDYAQEARSAQIEKKPGIYREMIETYYDFKRECYKKNECFAKYFADMWEHCSNSRNDDFEYITPFEDELKEIESNYAELLRNERVVRNAIPSLRNEIIGIVSRHNEGILQTDIYKMFDDSLKDTIRDEIYQCCKDDLITRDKQGRTYLVKLK